MQTFDDVARHWRQSCAALDEVRKVFLVGCGRSGTKWLMNILNAHEHIVIRGEGRFFWQLAPLLAGAFKGFNDALPYRPDHVTKLRDLDYSLLLRTIIDNQLLRYLGEADGKADVHVVGDKTPMHAIAVKPLHALYPEAKFIQIIRDPRDVTVSQWFFWARENDPRDFEDFVHYSITHVWPLNVRSAREAGNALGHDRYAEVRYEDLHAQTETELQRLLGFLGVSADAITVSRCVEAGRFERHSGGRARGNVQPGHQYRSGRVGDWREHIPEALAARCCGEIAGLMEACGYAIDPSEHQHRRTAESKRVAIGE